jgi:uncharacterized protein
MTTRVVLDTNIFISALLNPIGSPARVFSLATLGRDIELCMSGDTYAEYEDVIRRPRLRRSEREIEAALRTIREKSLWVRPTEKVHICSDPDDDIFLECAQAAKAHYLITGNMKDFPSTWAGTQIVTAIQFLDLILW